MSRGLSDILETNSVLAGHYRISRCLSVGSTAIVYLCYHEERKTKCVIKVLREEALVEPGVLNRFLDEMVASFRINHRNVVRAFEYFEDKSHNAVGYAMEFVEGGDLVDLLNTRGKLSFEDSFIILSQIGSALNAIHDAGVIHRDIKPENILVTPAGLVKLTDFGISRLSNAQAKLTEKDGILGTIEYISPEYLEHGIVDHRSDIYALGTVAYELFAGKRPYVAGSVMSLMCQKVTEDPEAPSLLNPVCGPKIDRLILRAMDRNPEQRYQSVAEFMADLERAAASPLGDPQQP